MAKLLIHTKAATSHPSDVKINAMQFQPGHVITIIEDDQEFGAFDIGPHSTVVSLPGIAKVDVAHLVSPEKVVTTEIIGLDSVRRESITQLRMWKAKNVADLKIKPVIPVTKGQELAFTEANFEKVPQVVDPLVIG